MWIDPVVEYLAGFSFGLFIFQSLFMKRMMGVTYWENVKMSFMPEFISMKMAGMAPTMSLLMMGRDMRAMDPLELVFWGVMSLGVMVGFTTAYPFNVWMVKKGIKHGLMTERAGGKHKPERHEGHGRQESEHRGHGAMGH
jgi:Sec-independent protein secretion pathway component TatC